MEYIPVIWIVTPYLDVLKELPKVGYLDMGMESLMVFVREAFFEARLAVLYSPVKLQEESLHTIKEDMETLYRELAPCDIVMADITYQTPANKDLP